MGTINRAPYNALVDDTGTGTTGTLWGKDDIKDVLLDPIDTALYLAGTYPLNLGEPLNLPLAAGVYNDYFGGGATVWMFNPAAAITITGIAAAGDGRAHLLINGSGFAITLPNNDARSTYNNQFIGPGFASFTLGIWRSVWIQYVTLHHKWIILQP